MTKFLAALIAGGFLVWPSHSWASCTYADGTAAPQPGLSQEAVDSEDWNPTFVRLFKNLNEGDRSTLAAIVEIDNSALLTNKCSDNDLLWTHLSLVGMSREDPDPGLPPEATADFRVFVLTEYGREMLPDLIRSAVHPN